MVTGLVLVVATCNLPRDADGTLDRVQNGVIRVGLAHNPPWVVTSGTQAGFEPQLVAGLARQLNAKTAFVNGSETRLLESLHRRELDLVVGGFTDDSPWKGQVAFTKPYRKDPDGKGHVLALAPGENAWLVRVEKFLQENKPGGEEGEK